MNDDPAGNNSARRAEATALVDGVLDKVPLIDGHNDLPLVILNDERAKGDVATYDLTKRHEEGDTDIPRLKAGRIGMQVWAAFTDSTYAQPATRTLELIDVVHQMSELHPSVFRPVRQPGDIMEAKRDGRIGAMLAVEGGVGLQNSLAPLRIWYRLGVRLMTLCHNRSLDWVDSATDKPRCGGLSDFGRQVVRELNRLGIMVDCAHVAPEAMRQVLDVSTAPIVFSHSNALALCGHARNVPDDVLDRLAANDGIVMATFVPDFVSEEVREWMAPVRKLFGAGFSAKQRLKVIAEYEREHGTRPRAHIGQVADHIDYMASRVGVDRVGIGSDFFGIPINTRGLEDVGCIKDLLVEMALRGWSDDNIAKLAGLNFIRVFGAVEAQSTTMCREEKSGR